jgi:hypothetical protein
VVVENENRWWWWVRCNFHRRWWKNKLIFWIQRESGGKKENIKIVLKSENIDKTIQKKLIKPIHKFKLVMNQL